MSVRDKETPAARLPSASQNSAAALKRDWGAEWVQNSGELRALATSTQAKRGTLCGDRCCAQHGGGAAEVCCGVSLGVLVVNGVRPKWKAERGRHGARECKRLAEWQSPESSVSRY